MRADEGVQMQGLSGTSNGPSFNLRGGLYQIVWVGTGWGSIELSELGPDGSTWLSVSAVYVANGGDTIYLPPGSYRWVIVTATDVSAGIYRIPGE